MFLTAIYKLFSCFCSVLIFNHCLILCFRCTPIGIGSVICGKIISLGNLSDTITQLSWFILTVFIGVAIHQLIILQIIYYIVVRKNPLSYYLAFGPSIITAFATASK